MQNKFINRLLDQAIVYNLIQAVFAPGADRLLTSHIRSMLSQLPHAEKLLDVGCGPQSWLWRVGLSPVGLDLTYSYCQAFSGKSEPVVAASSAAIPIANGSFDGVWSVGMFHHLPDPVAKQAIEEMIRVCRPGGYVAIIDAVLPEPAWRRPLAYLIRKRDRGQFVRSQASFENVLSTSGCWDVQRAKYSHNGLEVLLCWRKKDCSELTPAPPDHSGAAA